MNEEILKKLLQFAMKSVNPDAPQQALSEILGINPSDEYVKNLFDSVKNDDQKLTLEIVKSHYSLSDGVPTSSNEKNQRKEAKVTVTGEKNAKLICIVDDNSDCVVESETPIQKASSETQTDIKENHKFTQKSKQAPQIKISRLKKCYRQLQPLAKNQALAAIQYKLDFYRLCKNNPMYKRSTTCQPWLLMSRTAETIFDECLLEVAGEIELNDIVEKLIQEELQV